MVLCLVKLAAPAHLIALAAVFLQELAALASRENAIIFAIQLKKLQVVMIAIREQLIVAAMELVMAMRTY